MSNMRTLTDAALKAITLADIAEEAGIAHQTLKAYRQQPGNLGYRQPTPEAETAIAKAVLHLAEQRTTYFKNLAVRARKAVS